MKCSDAIKIAEETGFSASGIIYPDMIEFRQDVRDMCSADRCNKYGKSWTCPPACGTLEEIREKALKYKWGIVLQTTGKLEDAFDVDSMMETEKIQKERFDRFVERLKQENAELLPMSAGACTLCGECTYPGSPCRYPEKAFPSMESYGLLVTDTCAAAGIEYYYGPNTITYTCLVLVR